MRKLRHCVAHTLTGRYIPKKEQSILKFFRILIIWSLLMAEAVAQNVYFTARGEQNGNPVIYRSIENVPEGQNESDFPTLVSIYWPFNENVNNGMPDQQTNEEQVLFEDALETLDQNGMSHLMLVVTGNGRKEWLWYVKDADSWMAKLNELLIDHKVYPVEISISSEPSWSTYHNFISGVKGI